MVYVDSMVNFDKRAWIVLLGPFVGFGLAHNGRDHSLLKPIKKRRRLKSIGNLGVLGKGHIVQECRSNAVGTFRWIDDNSKTPFEQCGD